MDRYQRGKIYKIIAPDTDMVYIGSTTQETLAQRFAGHRRTYNCWKVGKACFVSSFKLLEHPESKIVLIESYPCNSCDELRAREQYYIELYGDKCVNNRKSYTGLTNKADYDKMHYNENKEMILWKQKQYAIKNKESIDKRMNQSFNCECGSKYTYSNKSQHFRTQKHQNYLESQKNIAA